MQSVLPPVILGIPENPHAVSEKPLLLEERTSYAAIRESSVQAAFNG